MKHKVFCNFINFYKFSVTGIMQTNWIRKDGQWYYFNSNGAMQTEWLQSSSGKWYYFNWNGIMLSNTVINGYRLNYNGEWVK